MERSLSISKDVTPEIVDAVHGYFTLPGVSGHSVDTDFSELVRGLLKADRVLRGSVSCSFSVLPFVTNFYKGLHGGAVASIAERVSIACARTVVAGDKPLFLGELSIAYLSSAQQNEEVTVDGSVVRSGRNLTVVANEFRVKKTRKLVYTARATFYHMPSAKL